MTTEQLLNTRSGRYKGLTLAALACMCFVAGCGNDGDASSPSSTSYAATSGPATLVPQPVRSKGEITVVTDATFPPYGMHGPDGKSLEGLDVDTAKALEPLLALRLNVVEAGFDNFIPGLKSGRYDAGFNGITDNVDRRKTVDFINFAKYGYIFITTSGSSLKVTSLESACGVKMGAENGSDTLPVYEALNTRCAAIGKPAPEVSTFDTQASAFNALTSSRVDAVLAGSDTGYVVKNSNGKYIINGPELPGPDGKFLVGGLVLPKGSPLAPAMLAGITELYQNGTLKKLFAQYGIATDLLIPPTLDTGDGPTPSAS